MLGMLSSEQIDQVLHTQLMGRIGCCAEGKVYVVPVSYAYYQGAIYAHSREGQKIHTMRRNPAVCFEVDQMENLANWCSVILWGIYEELRYPPEREECRKILEAHLSAYAHNEAVRGFLAISPDQPARAEKLPKQVYFRIRISKRSGRFEKQQSPSSEQPEA